MKALMKKYTVVVTALVCMLTVSGCANNSSTTNNSSSNETTSTANSQVIQTLKVGMLGKDIKTACIIIAKQLGYYEEEGINVEFETISNLSEGLTAVDMGKLDILPFGVIPCATFVAQGADVVVFGGTISEGSEIVVTPENAKMIQTLADFKGKKIGCYRMETGHMIMKGLLRKAGFDLDKDVQFVLLDSQQTIIEAVKKGAVDMGFLNSGLGYIAQKSGLVVARRVGEFEADFPCCRQSTSRGSLNNKRDVLVKFQIANLRAYETLMTDKQASVFALMKHSAQPREYVEAVIYGLSGEYKNAMIISLDPNKNKVKAFYEVMKDNKDIDPNTKFSMAEHIDTTIFEEALAQLQKRNPKNSIFKQLMTEFKVNNT